MNLLEDSIYQLYLYLSQRMIRMLSNFKEKTKRLSRELTIMILLLVSNSLWLLLLVSLSLKLERHLVLLPVWQELDF